MVLVVEVLATASAGLWVIGMLTVSVSGADSAESTVTVFDRFPPASISAWVTVWAAVDPGLLVCSLPSLLVSPVGPLGAASQFGSLTVTLVSVRLPVFVTVKVYGTT